jgi:anti-sigma regulatory factor (Ser/Thr protein kinase)
MSRPRPAPAPLRLPAEPRSVGVARRFVQALLEEPQDLLGPETEVDQETRDAAALVVSELVTNGILHARTDLELVVTLGDGVVRIEVADGSPGLPVAKPRSEHAGTGRGLTMVDAVSSQWGFRTAPEGGKTVWVDLRVPPS